jgi:ABC-type sugar transport system substrate-binding protein
VGGDGYEHLVGDLAGLGLGCMVLNRTPGFIEPLRRRHPRLPICAISPDQTEIGRIQGQQFRALLPKGGLVLYVQGPRVATSTQQRWAGMNSQIKGAGIELITLSGDWLADRAEVAVLEWLKDPRNGGRSPALIGCQNDAMAWGARRAVERLAAELMRPELRRVQITGCDGVPNFGQRMVAAGQLAATIAVPPSAGVAVELLARYFEQGSVPLQEVLLPSRSYPDRQELTTRRPAAAQT